MRRLLQLAACTGLVLILIPGCAGGGSGGSGGGSDRLTSEDIGSVDVGSLYEVVQRLRPRWLEVRGTAGFQTDSAVLVFMDRTYLGGVDELRSLGPEAANSLQFMRAAQAQAELRAPPGRSMAAAIVIHSSDRQRP